MFEGLPVEKYLLFYFMLFIFKIKSVLSTVYYQNTLSCDKDVYEHI